MRWRRPACLAVFAVAFFAIALVATSLFSAIRAADRVKRAPGSAAASITAPEIVEPIARDQDASAVQRTLSLLEQSAAAYTQKRECFSCHHQTLPAVTLAMARERGYDVDAKRMAEQVEFTLKYFGERRERLIKGDGVPGGPFSAGYALVGLQAAGHRPDSTTTALVTFLFQTQEKSGAWHIRTHRPPLEDSHFSATALAMRGIRLFAAKSQMEEAARRVGDARQWFTKSLEDSQPAATTQSLSNEDRTFRLLGLRWSEADKAAVARAANDLLAHQRSDGGWSQTADMKSDAYATGQALVALREAGGLGIDHADYRRGLTYLRQSRLTDGSWRVATRSKPVQTYFESGFPHGKSQFISICGTCWATQALLLGEQ